MISPSVLLVVAGMFWISVMGFVCGSVLNSFHLVDIPSEVSGHLLDYWKKSLLLVLKIPGFGIKIFIGILVPSIVFSILIIG